jgi:hypothetical protein
MISAITKRCVPPKRYVKRPSKRRLPRARSNQSKLLWNGIDRVLHVIEKIVAEPCGRGFVKQRCLDHLFLCGRKKTIRNHRRRLRARAIASSPEIECISPRR